METQVFGCETCNIKYKTRNGLWKHLNKYHGNNMETFTQIYSKSPQKFQNLLKNPQIAETKKSVCEFCKKIYSRIDNLKRHIKVCSSNSSNIQHKFEELNNKVQKLESELENVKNKPTTITNINKGIINKGPVFNFLNKPGQENINVLTEDEIERILDQEMNCLITLVEVLNFNDKYPENHNFCNTALNDKYISTINTETLTIEKQRKKDFFDHILNNGLRNMRLLYDRMGTRAKKTAKSQKYKETIDNLTEFVVLNNKGKKTYVELINTLSFNKRHVAQSTWYQLMNNQVPINQINDESSSDSDDLIENPSQINYIESNYAENLNHVKKTIINESDSSDSELSSDNESDESDEAVELLEIRVQNKTYILDGHYLYNVDKTKLDNKGALFGKLINGKVVKTIKTDIEL